MTIVTCIVFSLMCCYAVFRFVCTFTHYDIYLSTDNIVSVITDCNDINFDNGFLHYRQGKEEYRLVLASNTKISLLRRKRCK